MKFTAILLAGLATDLALSSKILERQGCNANNCLRLVRGTNANQKPTLASRLADCSSFMKVTVTPATSTVTTNRTITTTLGQVLANRQATVTPSAVPTYATSVCKDAVAYSSACSCAGVNATTITAATPIATATATVTVTVCPSPLTKCGTTCNNLQSDTSNCGSCGNTCLTSNTCVSGVCTAPPPSLATCDGPSPCGNSPACGQADCNGVCVPDADGIGRCSPNSFNPTCANQASFPCNVNADCPGGACILDCCGFRSCYYPSDNAVCTNGVNPSRLFRRDVGTQTNEKTVKLIGVGFGPAS